MALFINKMNPFWSA